MTLALLPQVETGGRPREMNCPDELRLVDWAAGALTLGRRRCNCQESGCSGGGVSLDEPPQAAKNQQRELAMNRAACVRKRMGKSVAR